MIRFERTRDYRLVREIITNPKIYRWMADDSSPLASEYLPLEGEELRYVLAFDDEELLGLWLFVPESGVTWRIHTCLLPGHGFHRGREAGKGIVAWVWANTHCLRIVTEIPRYNRAALTFARDCGMKDIGINEASWMKHGKLHDQILLGMSKPEAK